MIDLERAAAALDASEDYLVLRRLDPAHWDFAEVPPADAKCGLYVDVETTGLNPSEDDVIELAMVAFRFSREGEIYHAWDAYHGFQESPKLNPEITEITGITAATIAGQKLDLDEIAGIARKADLVISHKADFDRKFCEALFYEPDSAVAGNPAFREKAWACSMEQVPWQEQGIIGGRRLKYLAQELGFFYDAHRATDDCWAGVEVLSRTLPKSGRTALAHLLDAARKPTWRVWAENSPFKEKDRLKARGYRWSPGDDPGLPLKSWYFDASDEAARDTEINWLRTEIYGSTVRSIRVDRISAYDRFAVRDWREGNWVLGQ